MLRTYTRFFAIAATLCAAAAVLALLLVRSAQAKKPCPFETGQMAVTPEGYLRVLGKRCPEGLDVLVRSKDEHGRDIVICGNL